MEQAGEAWQSSDGSSWRGAKYANKHGLVPWQKPKGPKPADRQRVPAYDAPAPPSKGGGKGNKGQKGQEARDAEEGMVSQVQRRSITPGRRRFA